MPTRDEAKPVSMKISPDLLTACDRAAQAAGMSRHAWMVVVLASACGYSALPGHLDRVRPRR